MKNIVSALLISLAFNHCAFGAAPAPTPTPAPAATPAPTIFPTSIAQEADQKNARHHDTKAPSAPNPTLKPKIEQDTNKASGDSRAFVRVKRKATTTITQNIPKQDKCANLGTATTGDDTSSEARKKLKATENQNKTQEPASGLVPTDVDELAESLQTLTIVNKMMTTLNLKLENWFKQMDTMAKKDSNHAWIGYLAHYPSFVKDEAFILTNIGLKKFATPEVQKKLNDEFAQELTKEDRLATFHKSETQRDFKVWIRQQQDTFLELIRKDPEAGSIIEKLTLGQVDQILAKKPKDGCVIS